MYNDNVQHRDVSLSCYVNLSTIVASICASRVQWSHMCGF